MDPLSHPPGLPLYPMPEAFGLHEMLGFDSLVGKNGPPRGLDGSTENRLDSLKESTETGFHKESRIFQRNFAKGP